MKKLFFLLLSGVFLLNTGPGCRPREKRDPRSLLYHLVGEPDTLNRLTATDAYESRINRLLFDSLLERDNATLEFKPKLASRWEVSEDRLQYTFYLRSDVRWHDGRPLTADDVVYTFQQTMNPKVDAPHLRIYYQDIDKVEKLDDHTLRFTYKIPYFKALEIVGEIPIIPRHIFDDGQEFNGHPANRHPIGNGPYRFKEWQTGKRIVLEKNPDYWDSEKIPDIDRIVFQIIPDEVVAFQALKKEELDTAGLTPKQWVLQSQTESFDRAFQRFQYYLPSYRYIAWNLRKPPFKDKKVRQALARLVNRESIVRVLEHGLGQLTTGPFWVSGYEYNAQLPQIPFDPEGAKKLLEEAGWVDHDQDGIRDREGVAFSFTLLIPAGVSFYADLATIMKKDLEKAGISMQIQTMEWATFVKQLDARNFDAVSLAWSMGFDQDPSQVWHSSQGEKGSNFVGFSNPEADKIMEEARQTFDKTKRAQLYHRLHAIIYDEQPYAFLYSGPSLVAVQRRFSHVQVYPGGLDLREWKVKISP